jgi:hypothetical protein
MKENRERTVRETTGKVPMNERNVNEWNPALPIPVRGASIYSGISLTTHRPLFATSSAPVPDTRCRINKALRLQRVEGLLYSSRNRMDSAAARISPFFFP